MHRDRIEEHIPAREKEIPQHIQCTAQASGRARRVRGHILGLEVAVDNAGGVDVLERPQNLVQHRRVVAAGNWGVLRIWGRINFKL